MISKLLTQLALTLLVLGYAGGSTAQLLGENLVGTNVADVTYYSREYKFVDQIKAGEPWRVMSSTQWNTGEQPDLDANGWVKSIPVDRTIGTLLLRNSEGRWARDSLGNPIADWVVTYDGVGTFDIEMSSCQLTNATPGRFEITGCVPSNSGIHFVITSVLATDHARNIRIVPLAYEHVDTDTDQVFFLYTIAELSTYTGPLRMGDLMAINKNDQVSTAANRPKLTDAQQTGDQGVALEYVIQLANEAMRDLWLNVPHRATDDWVTNAAQLVQANLDPALKVIVEYSNEAWNPAYAVHLYTQQKAIDDGVCTITDPPYRCGLQWYAKRANEIHDIFEAQLGDGRVIRLHAGQSANTWGGQQMLNFDSTSTKTEVYAIAPYFCFVLGTEASPSATEPAYDEVDEVLEYCRDVNIPFTVFPEIAANKAMVDAYGEAIELWAYEGGQHLVGVGSLQPDPVIEALFTAANRDPEMGSIYRMYFKGAFERGVEVFSNYTTATPYTEWGSWGIREFDDQQREDSAKYDAVMCMLLDGDFDGNSIPDCLEAVPVPMLPDSALVGLAVSMLGTGGFVLTRLRQTFPRV